MIEGFDFFIILILFLLIFKLSEKGFSYIFISNLVLSVNFIGNLYLEEYFFTTTNLNFLIFIILHLAFHVYFKKHSIVYGNSSYNKIKVRLRNGKVIWLYLIFFLMLVIFFFSQVGIMLFMDNLRESRTLLKFGSGLFSRVILHGIPILAGIFICIYFERKNKYYLIIPALSLLIILLTGYRGFVIWTLLYFMMISNRFKRIKIYNAKIGFALLFILSFSVFLTKQYFTNSTYEVAASKFIERVFISNVYGYNILLNNYMDTHNIGVTEVSDLPSDLFTYEFGSGGYLVDLGAELTVTLPGMSYALGGYLLTVLFAIFIGSISGYLERKNLNSTDALHIAVRTFVLFSFITLINRGYIFNFLTIAMVSLVFVYVLILVSSKKKFVHHV